jgi:hypothetical protein
LTYGEIDIAPGSWKRITLGAILLASKVNSFFIHNKLYISAFSFYMATVKIRCDFLKEIQD